MAIIQCNECGRAISDKASTCVGCGAPVLRERELPGFNISTQPGSTFQPLTPLQLTWRALGSASVFIGGIIWASVSDHREGGGRTAGTLAALMIIVGLCWCIVTAVQGVLSLRPRRPQ